MRAGERESCSIEPGRAGRIGDGQDTVPRPTAIGPNQRCAKVDGRCRSGLASGKLAAPSQKLLRIDEVVSGRCRNLAAEEAIELGTPTRRGLPRVGETLRLAESHERIERAPFEQFAYPEPKPRQSGRLAPCR